MTRPSTVSDIARQNVRPNLPKCPKYETGLAVVCDLTCYSMWLFTGAQIGEVYHEFNLETPSPCLNIIPFSLTGMEVCEITPLKLKTTNAVSENIVNIQASRFQTHFVCWTL